MPVDVFGVVLTGLSVTAENFDGTTEIMPPSPFGIFLFKANAAS